VQDYVLREFGNKLLDDDNISSMCINGYGILKRDDPKTSLRAMARFLNGKSWHNWVMAHHGPEECNPIIASPDAVHNHTCSEVTRLFGIDEDILPHVHATGTHGGLAMTRPGIWPAKVIAIVVFEEVQVAPATDSIPRKICRLVVHSPVERVGPQTADPGRLIGECWRMEYAEPSKSDAGESFPTMRMIDPSAVAATVLVHDPVHAHPMAPLSSLQDEPILWTVHSRDSI
jgi:hypothetical protein